MAEETILLDVQIDQSDAQKQLVQTEKNLLNLKKQQADLTKEYKAGKISQDDYVQANLRLQKSIQKENDQKRTLNRLIDTESNSRNALKNQVSILTKEYDNLNRSTSAGAKRAAELEKELSELNAEINKSSKSAGLFKDQIGNYPDQFSKATEEIKPFGQSVSGLSGAFSKFLNPATAALGIVTGLATAYASSVTGANDLAFAQSRLAAAVSLTTNAFANFISTGEDGEGLISRFTDEIFTRFLPGLAGITEAIATAELQLKNLEISRSLAAAAAKEDERRAENLRRIRDDENNSLQERLAVIEDIDGILSASAQRSVTVIQAQINAIKTSTIEYDKNRQAQLQVAQLEAEIADKQEEINGKLTENFTARRNILKLIEQERQATAADDRAQRRAIDTAPSTRRDPTGTDFIKSQGVAQVNAQKAINDSLLKANKEFYDQDLKNKQAATQAKANSDIMAANVTADVLGASAALFEQNTEQYKVLATAQTLIDTYVGAQRAFNALAGIVPAGPALGAAAAAAAVIAGLGRVAAINNVQFAEGGYTGPGSKYQPAGIVHAGEYVAPQSVMSMPAAQPHIAALEGMRTGKRSFADGGFVAQQAVAPYQLALITANAIKNMPQPVVSWTEGRATGRRVEWREQISKR